MGSGNGFVPFEPNRLVRDGTVQTLLAMAKPRDRRALLGVEQPILLDAGPDQTGYDGGRHVRLLGYYLSQPGPQERRGLVLLLHGWEGHSHSAYNLWLSKVLLAAGYDVFGLNFRDHGPTHHLNRGFFYATLIEEVATATHRISALSGNVPFFIVGASLGGNFALRLALWHGRQHFQNLRQVIAVSPAINPGRTSQAMDRSPLYRRFFRQRWLRSIRYKQALFPDLYDFTPLERTHGFWEMTDWLVKHYGPYVDADDYFDRYTVVGDAFRDLNIPTTIITAADDPIIPVIDFYQLAPHPLLHVQVHPTGGHVGFADILPLRSCLAEMVLNQLEQIHQPSGS